MKRIYSRTIEKSCGFAFALWSAGAKAFEYSLPPHMRIIEDPLAHYYSGSAGLKMVQMLQVFNPALRRAIVLRARFIDDYARESIKSGYRQIVIMGAGYDSRYWRIPEFHDVDIFELDLESTQMIKKSLTRGLVGSLPSNIKYISLDFSRQDMIKKLLANGFKKHEKTLFIWEGVSLFLNLEIVLEILGRIAQLGNDNRVVFDFVPLELVEGETEYPGNQKLIELCASIKEPLTFGCAPEKMNMLLHGLGFRNINIISLRQASRIYCGSDQIEDCYYFTTAESGNGIIRPDPGSNANG